MNKHLLWLAIATFMVFAASTEAQTIIDTTAATGIGTSIETAPVSVPMSVREKIRTEYGTNMQNAKTNQEVRNTLVSRPYQASSTVNNLRATNAVTKPLPIRNVNGTRPEISSTTAGQNINRQNTMKTAGERIMRLDQFKNRKEILTRQMKTAVNNLIQIRERISSRIEKERQNGRDMTKAISLLSAADTKISVAKENVKAIDSYTPVASSTASSSNTTVDAEKAREMIRIAEKSLHDARQSLNDVIVAIAHAMGLKIGQNGRIPSPVPTSSASSTTPATVI